MNNRQLNEGSQAGDLDYLINNKIHFDEYDSKMGKSESVVTASFKVKQREPALDLVRFLENGYDWILDADVSTGEIQDGEFLVFLEMQRTPKMYDNIVEMMDDLRYLTNIEPDKWEFRWFKDPSYKPFSRENLREAVPSNPTAYRDMVEGFSNTQEAAKGLLPDIEELKRLSGIK